jgi:transcriptional regulator with XRE-family HTH domain
MQIFLGEPLRQYRKRKNKTQQDFAESIYISLDYIQKLESKSSNRRKPLTLELTLLICETYEDYSLYVDWRNEFDSMCEQLLSNSQKIS